ncbi:NACHT, LRR and PYD domains-containing protein 9B-like isoform X1 [Meriones unguiculatus]|uniref:NACHT, LRR and PYD domains-containing protein 9B-like isoform X1 n=1 Tax=Meriones unguiculatus TaxID=10047 RepID=UPI00293EFAE9|nr:NACHT, LRR and PYD domains-containing protein 9B-like isoform X1 [Meriones unguiculatus]
MADSPDYDLLQYLQNLSDEEFLTFKELLREEPKKFHLKPISWTQIEKASKEDLVTLLNTHYPGWTWEVVVSLFQQVNRNDLSNMVQRQRRDKQTRYKEHMKTAFQRIWNFEANTHIPDRNYQVIIEPQYRALQEVFYSESEPVTAVVLGVTGEGKTVFLRKAMLDWASGRLWQNRFRYVFFIPVFTLNNITEFSLASLVSTQLPESSETVEDILSHPRRILFILDGFDYLKFDLELRTNLSDDWRESLPTQIVFSSLLQKKMLPEASLLLELGNRSLPKIGLLLQYPREITIGGFSEESIEFYCMSFFDYHGQGSEVYHHFKQNPPFLVLCRSPYLCWLFCSSLKWQIDRGGDVVLVGGTDTATYTSFLVNAFKSMFANVQSNQNRARLKTLCTLAVEGMWTQEFVFDFEDLRKNGISEHERVMWLRMKFFRNRGRSFAFYHPDLQSYFAALFYFLGKDTDKPRSVIGSLSQLLRELFAHGQTRWLKTGIFLFGITAERVTSMLRPCFGLIPSREIKQEIINYLKSLSQQENNEKLSSPLNLVSCLLDSQEERFVTQVMNVFEEMTVDISNSDVVTDLSYGLLKATKLKKLHLHIEKRVFPEVFDPEYFTSESFEQSKTIATEHWAILCRMFYSLHVLDLDSCHFNEEAIQILCDSMSPSHTMPLDVFELQSLLCSFMTNFGDGSLFHTFLKLPQLRSLNLYGTNLSKDVVENLCSALKYSTCSVKELLLGKCDISSEACGIIATTLMYCKVKHLSLVENPLKNRGVVSLCELLKRPTCVLETLMLSYCCLTFIACGHLYEALLCNKRLSLLDLGSNFLEDTGVNILCEALKDPACPLQELWLSGCYLTSECCEAISGVLTCNRNLKTLKLGNNNIQDAGVKQLCEALRHRDCKLQCLGLDMCEFTTDCCEDLALALTSCKTLTSLNLDWISLDHAGVDVLCEALSHKDCNLKMLGLDKSALSEESQALLQAVEKSKSNLNILHYPWVEEEREKRGVRLVWNSKN